MTTYWRSQQNYEIETTCDNRLWQRILTQPADTQVLKVWKAWFLYYKTRCSGTQNFIFSWKWPKCGKSIKRGAPEPKTERPADTQVPKVWKTWFLDYKTQCSGTQNFNFSCFWLKCGKSIKRWAPGPKIHYQKTPKCPKYGKRYFYM